MKRPIWLLWGVVLAGCGVDRLDEHRNAPVAKEQEEVDLGCGPNCTGNSPILAALGPFEASLNGDRETLRGWKLYPTSFRKGDKPITEFQVNGASLAGTLVGEPVPQMKPSDFVDVYFRMNGKNDGDYEFHIDNAIEVKYYPDHDLTSIVSAPPPPPLPKIWAYHIWDYPVIGRDRHTSLSVEWKHLCPYTEHDPNDPDVEANWVVFWKGDRYHPDTGEIYASGDAVGDWFNISCAREAGVEMLRTGTGEAVAPYTSRAKRQAVLNMFMAKYCPTPERFTELGKWLYWDGTKAKRLPSMLNNIGTISSFEGIWNEDGVVCLDKHRDDSKVLTCRPPPCAGMVDDWQAHGILQSWIPKTLTAQLSPP